MALMSTALLVRGFLCSSGLSSDVVNSPKQPAGNVTRVENDIIGVELNLHRRLIRYAS